MGKVTSESPSSKRQNVIGFNPPTKPSNHPLNPFITCQKPKSFHPTPKPLSSPLPPFLSLAFPSGITHPFILPLLAPQALHPKLQSRLSKTQQTKSRRNKRTPLEPAMSPLVGGSVSGMGLSGGFHIINTAAWESHIGVVINPHPQPSWDSQPLVAESSIEQP